jgi:hypothetical protein
LFVFFFFSSSRLELIFYTDSHFNLLYELGKYLHYTPNNRTGWLAGWLAVAAAAAAVDVDDDDVYFNLVLLCVL